MVPRSGQDPTLDAFMRKHPGSSNVADYEHGAKMYPWGEGGSHEMERITPTPRPGGSHDAAPEGYDAPRSSKEPRHYPYGDPADRSSFIDHYDPAEDRINHFNRLSWRHEGLAGPDGVNMSDASQREHAESMPAPQSKGAVPDSAFKMDSNVPQGGGSGPGTPGSGNPLDPNSFTASFFDPRDASVRVLAADDQDAGGSSPAPPGQMQGGPGANAMPPMEQGASSSNVPQTTSPRQEPSGGGGGMPPGMPGGDSNTPAPGGPPGVPKSGYHRIAEGPSKAVETLDDPSGLGDEYAGKQYEKALESRPRQHPDDRGVNSPLKPRDPIPTVSSPGTPGGGDEEDRREASRIAAAAARAVLERV